MPGCTIARWMEMVWFLAHRLELALKRCSENTLFSSIDEMLLRVYFLYENSPKKCRKLEGIIEELAQCLAPTDMPMRGGTRSVRACGDLCTSP